MLCMGFAGKEGFQLPDQGRGQALDEGKMPSFPTCSLRVSAAAVAAKTPRVEGEPPSFPG